MITAQAFLEKNSFMEETTGIDVISISDAYTALKIQEKELLDYMLHTFVPLKENVFEEKKKRLLYLTKQLKNI